MKPRRPRKSVALPIVNGSSLAEAMHVLGFVSEDRQSWTLWRWHPPKEVEPAPAGESVTASKLLPIPWRMHSCELAERRHGLSLQRLELQLDQAQVTKNLQRLSRRYLGSRTQSYFVASARDELWCIFEFTKPGAAKNKASIASPPSRSLQDPHDPGQQHTLPYGIGGFSMRLRAVGTELEIILCDYFAIGYCPPAFAAAPQRLVAEALGLAQLASLSPDAALRRGIFESTLQLGALFFVACQQATSWSATNDAAAIAKQLLEKRQALTSVCMRGTNAWTLVATSDASLTFPIGTGFAPMEVLEARERAGRYGDVDAQIIASKYSKALKTTKDFLEQDPLALYLIRRLCLLGIAGQQVAAVAEVEAALKLEPKNKLFLAYAAQAARDAGRPDLTLEYLSRLGQELLAAIPGADALGCFDLVLPELLGDAWCSEDREQASQCYTRILAERGELPRILRKLIQLANISGDWVTEQNYLQRLAQVERRRSERAKIFFRLAELKASDIAATSEAIALGLEALKNDGQYVRAVVLVADLLLRQQRPEEAIQLLDTLLHCDALALRPKVRGNIAAKIGKIWLRELHRPDLAQTRYEYALSVDRDNLASMRDLEEIYRQRQCTAELVQLLESQFSLLEEKSDIENLRLVFDELVTLYRGVLGQPQRAFELYQRVIGSYFIEPEEIDRILAWRDIQIDWRDLYGKLVQRLPLLTNGVRRAQYLCRLAEICRDKIGESKMSLHHLLDALTDGWIDPLSFQFVTTSLAAVQDYSVLARCYEQRIAQVPEGEQRQLLMELLALPEVLPEHKRDALALRVQLLDAAAGQALQQRFRHYLTQADLDGMARLLEKIASEKNLSILQKTDWLRYGIQVLEGFSDARRFHVMELAFRNLLILSEDSLSQCHAAIECLQRGSDLGLLTDYVVRLLRAGTLPRLDEPRLRSLLLERQTDLALFHQLASYQAVTKDVAASQARMAAALYRKLDGEQINAEKMLARQCYLQACSPADLMDLRTLVEYTGHWSILAQVLHRQVEFEEDTARRGQLLADLGEVWRIFLKDSRRALAVYQLCLKYTADPVPILLVILELAAERQDLKTERRTWRELLKTLTVPTVLVTLPQAVARMLVLGESARSIQKLLQPHILEATAMGQHELAAQICQALLVNQIVSSELYRLAFRGAVLAEQLDQAVDLWWQGLACVANRSKAKAYILDTKQWLEKESRRDLLQLCFKAAFDHNLFNQLGPNIYREFLIQYGSALFDADATRAQALPVYREAYAADPNDNRTWMPLYFLLLEFGTKIQRLQYLQEIIPRLIVDAQALKAFPITIESLKAELDELMQEALSEDKNFAASPPLARLPLPDAVLNIASRDESQPHVMSRSSHAAADDRLLQQVAGEVEGFGSETPSLKQPMHASLLSVPLAAPPALLDLELGELDGLRQVIGTPSDAASEDFLAFKLGGESQLRLVVPEAESPADDRHDIELGMVTDDSLASLPQIPGAADSEQNSGSNHTASINASTLSGDEATLIDSSAAESDSSSHEDSQSRPTDDREPTEDLINWRDAIIKGDFNSDLTTKLLSQAFASEMEKHLAIQATALVAGNCDKLNSWHWRVWRRPQEYGYAIAGKERYPAGYSPPILHSSLCKYILMLAPVFVRLHRERFTNAYLARRLQCQPASIERKRLPLSWEQGTLAAAGLNLYAARIRERRYLVYNMPGLNKELFYEGANKALYFDEAYYKKVPPSHLFHRILGILWSVRSHYFVPLALDPQRHILPVLQDVNQHFSAHGISKFASALRSKSDLSRVLAAMDSRLLRSLNQKLGVPSEDALLQLWEAMRLQIFRLLIAETLDIVGVFESILDRDLLQPGVLTHSEIYQHSPFIKRLIEFVTKLHV